MSKTQELPRTPVVPVVYENGDIVLETLPYWKGVARFVDYIRRDGKPQMDAAQVEDPDGYNLRTTKTASLTLIKKAYAPSPKPNTQIKPAVQAV